MAGGVEKVERLREEGFRGGASPKEKMKQAGSTHDPSSMNAVHALRLTWRLREAATSVRCVLFLLGFLMGGGEADSPPAAARRSSSVPATPDDASSPDADPVAASSSCTAAAPVASRLPESDDLRRSLAAS